MVQEQQKVSQRPMVTKKVTNAEEEQNQESIETRFSVNKGLRPMAESFAADPKPFTQGSTRMGKMSREQKRKVFRTP